MEGTSVKEDFAHITAAQKICDINIRPIFSSYDVMKIPNIDGESAKLTRSTDLIERLTSKKVSNK